MKKIIVILLCLFSYFAYAKDTVNLKEIKTQVIKGDARNAGVIINLTNKGPDLWFCVDDLGNTSSQNDVFRVLLQVAAKLKNQEYEQIILCHHRKTEFLLSGKNFSKIGHEFGKQNVLYTLRTFPEKLRLADGSKAFSRHQGGVLYVMNQQMKDFKIVNLDWYLSDILRTRQAEKDIKRPKSFAKDEDVF
ncbi:hypothetical protein V6259_17215 [Marinomonas sp. TI.3.20]|uniref:hypothetical protein n=1 Tax=Marinomonas sp. TI.3.20 TaxID=3121296 RepID=UPI00311F53ED